MLPSAAKLVQRFRSASATLSGFGIAVGIIMLAGWIFHPSALSVPLLGPDASLAILLLGLALRSLVTRPPAGGISTETTAYAIPAILLGIAVLALEMLGSRLQLGRSALVLALESKGLMSPTMAIEIILLGLSSGLLQSMRPRLQNIGQVIAAIAAITAFYACMVALISSGSLAHYYPMPPLSAVPALALGLSALAARPETLLSGLLCTERVGGRLARYLIAAGTVVLIASSWLALAGAQHNFYDAGLGLVILMVWFFVVCCGIAVLVGRLLNRLDCEYDDSVVQLKQLKFENELSFQNVQDAFIVVDASSRVLDWNKQAQQMLGWSKDEMVGRILADDIFSSSDKSKQSFLDYVRTHDNKTLEGQHEFKLSRKDNGEVPVELSVSAIPSEIELRYFLVLRDVSERNRLSNELARARDEAMESSRLKSEFVANMSHEIRTPLNAIIGMSDILARRQIPADTQDIVETIHNSADALLDIVNDILDYSKIEAGKLGFEATDFDMTSLVEGSTELVAGKAREKGLSVASYVPPDVPKFLRGDPGRIRQVLLNFLTNSVKFTNSGEVVLRASFVKADDRYCYIRFEVNDTGIGIESPILPHVFEPFTQANGSVTRRFGGTGLGLSISKRLVELMNGEIGAESTLGMGSTFWFIIPLERPLRRLQMEPMKRVFQDVSMLVVNGPVQSSGIVQDCAASWGIDCDRVETGEEALQLMRRRAEMHASYDVVVVDFELTHSDALALAQSIQRYPDLASTKLILISSFDDDQLRKDAAKAGFRIVLTKPLKQSKLYDSIVSLLTQRENGNDKVSPDSKSVFKLEPPREIPLDQRNLILIVEDNPVNQKVIGMQLKQLGYPAHTASTGLEALEAVSRTQYALILMDCQMPELDGFETTRLIRERESVSGKHTPIVALTAFASNEDRISCLSAGMDDYISKPANPKALQEILERYTAKRSEPVDEANAPSSREVDRRQVPSEKTVSSRTAGEQLHSDELLELYVLSTGKLLQQLESAVNQHDLASVKSTTHELLGSSANFDAPEMVNLSKEMEKASSAANWPKMEECYPELKSAFDKIRTIAK